MEAKKVTVSWEKHEDVTPDERGAFTIPARSNHEFRGRPQAPFRPDQLVLLDDSPVPLRLHSMQIADQVVAFDAPGERVASLNGLPAIDLRKMPRRTLHGAQEVIVTLTNPSDRDVKVRPVFHGMTGSDRVLAPTFLPAWATRRGEAGHKFAVPHQDAVAEVALRMKTDRTARILSPGVHVNHVHATVMWRSLWNGRITKLQIVSDHPGDIDLVDMRVGNRSQNIACYDLPVHLFQHPQPLHCDAVVTAQDVAFLFRNHSAPAAPRDVEIHLDFEPRSDADEDDLFRRLNADS